MPIKKSAVKELQKSRKREKLNTAKEKRIKDAAKKIRKAIIAGNIEEARTLAKALESMVDRAAKSHLIHKNAAARKKSRIYRAIRKSASIT